MPVAPVDAAILPVHFTVARLHIVAVVSSVVPTTGPFEFAKAVLLVIKVLTFVGVGVLLVATLFPYAFPDFHAVKESAAVCVAVGPAVLSVAVCLSIVILAQVDVTVRKLITPLAMPQTELPLALVLVTVLPLVDAVPVGSILVPLPYILVTIVTFPDAVAMLETLVPFTVVGFSIDPGVKALAVNFALEVVA